MQHRKQVAQAFLCFQFRAWALCSHVQPTGDVEKHSSCLSGVRDLGAALVLRLNRRWIAALLWVSYLSSHCQAWASLSVKSLVRLLHIGQRWCINSLSESSLWGCGVTPEKMMLCWTRLLWKNNQVQDERTVSSHHHFCEKLLWKGFLLWSGTKMTYSLSLSFLGQSHFYWHAWWFKFPQIMCCSSSAGLFIACKAGKSQMCNT